MELTLQQLFGANAFENGQILRINKSDLPGLTPSGNNSAESLLVAILLTSWRNFQGVIEDENSNAITDENGIPITFDNQDAYANISMFYWSEEIVIRKTVFCVRETIIIHEFLEYEY